MPNTRQRWILALMLILALTLTGVLAPAASAAPAPQQTGRIRVGYLGPANTDAAQGAQLAIDQINAMGGFTAANGSLFQIELITLEATPTLDTLASAVVALNTQGVVAILGPDNHSLLTAEGIETLLSAGIPILTGSTNDPLTDNDTSDLLFRLVAPESVYSSALAAVMVEDLQLTSIALVQTTSSATSGLLTFISALDEYDINPAAKIQLTDAARLMDEATGLIDVNPEAIVMWGPQGDAATLLSVLRKRGWVGTFAYRHAAEAAQTGELPAEFSAGVLGMTSWSYAYPGAATRTFLDDYVKAFGNVPGPLSAASYDALWYLRAVMQNVGITAADVQIGLLAGAPFPLVSGQLKGAAFGNGDLIHEAMVYQINAGGGATVIARFVDLVRAPIEDAGN
ncbi:MAG: ABC transporter substrate-binding protein [Anaerolineae bacterium]|nr:ABC transporter substrate-binding protein [Anaerolineae bacterium]